jgi:hypothetical protein
VCARRTEWRDVHVAEALALLGGAAEGSRGCDGKKNSLRRISSISAQPVDRASIRRFCQVLHKEV